MATSQNGWSANDVSATSIQPIPGTDRKVRLRTGNVGFLLTRIAAFIDAHCESVDDGELDDWGFAIRPVRGGTELSNHASGTALDINAVRHPLAAVGTWSKANTARIREHLTQYGGVVRWGGDYRNRKDEMHFEIVGTVDEVKAVAARLRGAPAPGGQPSRPPATPITVSIKVIQSVAAGAVVKPGTYEYNDVAFFMAWARRLKAITPANETAWAAGIRQEQFAGAGRIVRSAITAVQRHAGLTPDGIFGSKTAALLAHDGYQINP